MPSVVERPVDHLNRHRRRAILSRRATMKRIGVESASTFDRIRKNPELEFPQSVELSPGLIGFIEDEIEGWIAERIRQRDEEGRTTCRRAFAAVLARLRAEGEDPS